MARGAARAIVGLVLATTAGFSPRPAIASGGQPVVPLSVPHRLPNAVFQALHAKRVLLLGELHGTNEAPDLLYGMAALWRQHRRPVVVALEWPYDLQPAVDAALATGDVAPFRSHPFFRRRVQDGRSSRAMAELVGRLSRLGRVPVICIDPEWTDGPQGRDTGMALRLAVAAWQHPGATVIALTGNWHAQRQVITEQTPPFRPLGHELCHLPVGAVPAAAVVSLDITSAGGTAWVALQRRSGIHSRPLQRSARSELAGGKPYLQLFGVGQDGFDGRFFLPYRTAALPLVDPASLEGREPALRRELLAMMAVDQDIRNRWRTAAAAAKAKLAAEMARTDARHHARMVAIIDRYGWPGHALVGEDGAHAAWLLIQHDDDKVAFQERCLSLLEKAVQQGDASGQDLAYLMDRWLVNRGRPQRYGTQFHEVDGRFEPRTIEDASRVDERRAAVGLQPLADYARDMAEFYAKPTTLPSPQAADHH